MKPVTPSFVTPVPVPMTPVPMTPVPATHRPSPGTSRTSGRRGHRRAGWAAASLVVLLAATSCGQEPAASPSPPPRASPSAPGDGSCSYPPAGQAAKAATPPPSTPLPPSGKGTVVLATSAGDVTITLDAKAAPCTVSSFRSLVQQKFFDGTRCHRLVDAGIFVLQCGDPTGTGTGGPGYRFDSETDGQESYTRGVVAMANAGPGTNGSQFFLVWADSTSLDQTPDYTIFGKMNEASVGVVAKTAAEGTDANSDQPEKPVNRAEIVTATER